MAFLKGSAINPALGRTDFTPFLQGSLAGSQMAAQGAGAMGQGLAGLMSGVGQGIDAYKKNKEETKKLEGFLKAADKMSAGFEPIMDKIDPRIGQSIQQMRQMIGDPNLSVRERASAAQAFLQQAPVLLNAGVQFMDKENEAAATNQRAVEAAMQMQAKQQELQRKQQEEALKRQIELGASQYVASGGKMPQGVDQSIAPIIQAQGMKELADLQAKQASLKPSVPTGYEALPDGTLRATPGGPAAQKLADEKAKADEAKRMADERAALVREGALATLARVQDAFDISAKTQAGGPIEGLFPKVSAAVGLEENTTLQSRYDTIKAALALDQIQQLKELSKSGATGLGSVSNKELDVLQDSVAKLDLSLDEKEQRRNLQIIANTLAKIGKVEAPKLGATPRPNTLKGSTQSNRVRTYNPQTGRIE